MRWIALGLAIAATGCSFFLVKGPAQRVDVIGQGADSNCTEAPIIPLVDAVGGLALGGAAVGGVILEATGSDSAPDNFGKYYAAPLVIGSIVYFVAASKGNSRVTWCVDMKERIKNGETPRSAPVDTNQKDIYQVPGQKEKAPEKPPPAEQQEDVEDPNRKKKK
jgi:hypothetical protein